MNLNIPTNLKNYCVSSYPDWYSNWLSTDILNRSKKSNDSFKSLQKFTVKSNNDDLNALDYIYRYNNIKLSILWNTSYLKEYDKNTKISIIVSKYINLSGNGFINLIYQLYADSKILKYKVLIKDFIDKLNLDSINLNKFVVVLFFVNKGEHFNISINNGFYSDNYFQVVNHGRILFNNNSLKLLEKQSLDLYGMMASKKSKCMLMTFKKWLDSNIPLKYHDHFMIFSSAVLFSYGLRPLNDLDLFIDDNLPDRILNIIKHDLVDSDTRFPFIDTTIMKFRWGSGSWDIWMKKWAKLFGAKSINHCVSNPDFHFYFMGLKMICIEADIVRRLERNRPRAVADLLMINRKLGYVFDFKPIPKTSVIFVDYSFDTSRLKGLEYKHDKGDEIVCHLKTDINRFIGTIRWFLRTKYKFKEYSEEDIKNMLPDFVYI
jgi:hypothetical protein